MVRGFTSSLTHQALGGGRSSTTLAEGGVRWVAILKALPKLGEFVFAGLKTGKPLSNMAMLSVLKDMNRDESGEPRWVDPKSSRPITPHGLRATFRTWGEDAGFPRELLEESLGHQVGTAVERAYRRTDSFDRRRAIMQAWAKFCNGKRARNVVLPASILKITRMPFMHP